MASLGAIAHWPGNVWQDLDFGEAQNFHEMWKDPLGPLWVVGGDGTILRRDIP